jgi:ADP-dependent NAD(P)H-hydrate dehydratase / NAD(P)H-hydrate epimerase
MKKSSTRVYSIAELRELDRRASDEYGMPTLLLMEHAGQGLAKVILNAADAMKTQRVLIVVGPGNNGGDGYAAARLLLDSGMFAHVVAIGNPKEGSDAGVNAEMAANFGVPVHPFLHPLVSELFRQVDIVVDCIFGTGIRKGADGQAAEAIAAINAANDRGALIISADVPSGLEADLGLPIGPCVRADYTVSFAGLKVGYVREAASSQYTGVLVQMDLGYPQVLLESMGEVTDVEEEAAPAKGKGKAKAKAPKPTARRVPPRPPRRRPRGT